MQRWNLTPRMWLTCVLAYALTALALDTWAISRWQRVVDPAVAGSLGARFVTGDRPDKVSIATLAADSPLMAAGAAPGDQIRFDYLMDRSRILANDERIGLTLYHQGVARHLDVTAKASQGEASMRVFALDWAGNIIGIVCGILLAVRRPGPGPHRVLAIMLITGGFGSELHGLPNPFHDLYFRFAYPILMPIGWLSFTYFTMVYPGDAPLVRRPRPRFAFLALVIWIVFPILVKTAGREGLLPSPGVFGPSLALMEACAGAAAVSFAFMALWRSWSLSGQRSAAVRQGIEWIAFSLGLCYLTFVVPALNEAVGAPVPAEALFEFLTIVRSCGYVLLAYALLRRRLFDAGSALNRALVVAIISAVLLVMFALTEFAVDKLLHFHGRETSVVIDAAVALGVILGFHRIQHWVNHQVNHLFFHDWHQAAETLRTFMRGASHITSSPILQQRFVAAVRQFVDTGDVVCYRRQEGGNFAPFDDSEGRGRRLLESNDASVIALLDARRPTEVAEGWAFPMTMRGVVTGFVLVGAKRNGMSLRPDEVELLQQATQELALDLESLRVLSLEQERAAWHDTERELRARCSALEDVLMRKIAMRDGIEPAITATSLACQS